GDGVVRHCQSLLVVCLGGGLLSRRLLLRGGLLGRSLLLRSGLFGCRLLGSRLLGRSLLGGSLLSRGLLGLRLLGGLGGRCLLSGSLSSVGGGRLSGGLVGAGAQQLLLPLGEGLFGDLCLVTGLRGVAQADALSHSVGDHA